jgi:hypothetical protein
MLQPMLPTYARELGPPIPSPSTLLKQGREDPYLNPPSFPPQATYSIPSLLSFLHPLPSKDNTLSEQETHTKLQAQR